MSTNCTGLHARARVLLRWPLAFALLMLAMLYSGLAAAAASQYCPTVSRTVVQGNSIVIDVSNCDGPSDLGLGEDGSQPANGSSVLSGLGAGGAQTVTYTHNGNSATSDSFYYFDGDGDTITFNITITPALSASIAVSPASRNEDSGAAFTYTVTLSQTSSSATTVNIASSGTATSGGDYTGAVGSVVVPANTTTATFAITPVADGTVEANETVIMSVASGSGYGIGGPSSATATILDDDVPDVSIAVSPASVSEDGATNLVYTITLDQAPVNPVSVAFNVGGSATSGNDYAAVSSPLVIAAGQTSGTITINPTADSTVEADETAVISLASGSGYSVGSPDSATGTIANDDVPSLSINDVSLNEGDAGTSNATFTVSLSQPAGAGGVSFDIASADGSATAGVDYVASSLTGRTIPAGSSSATFTVLVNGDTLNEASENFFVNISNVSGASVSDAQGQGTIVNDDAQPALSIDDISVNEGNSGTTTATFTVSLSAASGQTVSVNYASADGTATAGSDYVARSGTLTFSPGTTAQGVAITVNGDTAVEPNETFSVDLSGASNAGIARPTGTGTINNDDVVVTVGPASLPSATAASAFSQTLTASGGTAPYSFVVSAGALPAGLSLSPAGVLSGTPTASGSFNFTATATDSGGSPTSGNRAYALVVASPTITLPATTLAGGTAGQAYTAAINPATGGIAPYTYTLSAGALPAGITVDSATGALSGTPTVAGTFNFSLTVTDSTTGTAGQASQSYSLGIVSPTLTIAPPTLPAGSAGSAYSQTLSTSGGTAPYSYAITAGALPTGLTLTTGGVLSGTPTVAGSFNFTVSVTDAGGFGAAQAYTLSIVAPTLTIAPSTLPAGGIGNAYSQTLSTSGGTAPYSYATTAGALPAGLNLTAAGVLSGTPTAAGSFNFTVSATDANGFGAAQAYTLSIASPTLTLAPPTLPSGTAGSAYSQALSASGGTAPYSYAVSAGALPAGLTLTTSGALSGTPTVAGSFTFTATVTDSTAGVAAQASRSYTLTIAAPTLTITPPTLAEGTVGSVYSQTLSTSGGTAPYAYAVTAGSLPGGLTLATGGVLSGTPTTAGSFNFTIDVTDAGGFGATQAYTLVIAAGVPAPVAVNDTGATLVDTALTLAVTGNDTGSIDSIAITTAPSHGTAVVNGLEVVYTPAAGYVGMDSVGYTATGAGGTSAPATIAITVNARPVAVSTTVQAVSGQAQTVDLTLNATGGPFVAAAMVALSPVNAGTAAIVRREGTSGAGPSFLLTFTPAAAFSGQATVRFTLSNAYATSDEASIVFMVAPRPDPTQDAEVRGLIDAQAESTRRFAKAQIDNFQRRLEATHRGERGFANNVSFQVSSQPHCREAERGMTAQPCSPATTELEGSSAMAAAPESANAKQEAAGDVGVWVGGAIRSGSLGNRTQRAGVDFQSDGLSVGADYRVDDSLAVGAGLGWGRDDSDIGNNGSHSKGTAYTLALYASFHPGKHFFLDTLLGYQLLSYDLRRYVTGDATLTNGSRDGQQWFASVSTGADVQRGAMQITPYARLDVSRGTLDGYSETGAAPFALRYDDMDVSTTTGNLGLRLEWRRDLSRGQFTPQVRMEYQHDFQGRGDATLGYADVVGSLYRTGLSVFDRNRFMFGVGAAFTTEQGLSTRVEYRGVTDGDSGSDQLWMLNVEKKY